MDLKVGQKAVLERVFTQEEFNRFAVLSGDDNPIHVDPEFSSRTKFGRTVAHGMFLYSNISRALGEILHGFAFAQLEQEMIFQAPTYTREKVEIRLEVLSLGAGGQAEIKTDVVKPDGQFGCQGRTIVSLPGSKVDRKDLQDDNKSP
ncbi:MAG: hypothetical protein EHM41_17240, partial [Chloroflexi bacterium]